MKRVKRAPILGDVPIQAACSFVFMERAAEGARKVRERRRRLSKHRSVLQRVLVVCEPEKPVFQKWPAEAKPYLIPLERSPFRSHTSGCRIIAEKIKAAS